LALLLLLLLLLFAEFQCLLDQVVELLGLAVEGVQRGALLFEPALLALLPLCCGLGTEVVVLLRPLVILLGLLLRLLCLLCLLCLLPRDRDEYLARLARLFIPLLMLL
jgi:hypothetical protein